MSFIALFFPSQILAVSVNSGMANFFIFMHGLIGGIFKVSKSKIASVFDLWYLFILPTSAWASIFTLLSHHTLGTARCCPAGMPLFPDGGTDLLPRLSPGFKGVLCILHSGFWVHRDSTKINSSGALLQILIYAQPDSGYLFGKEISSSGFSFPCRTSTSIMKINLSFYYWNPTRFYYIFWFSKDLLFHHISHWISFGFS